MADYSDWVEVPEEEDYSTWTEAPPRSLGQAIPAPRKVEADEALPEGGSLDYDPAVGETYTPANPVQGPVVPKKTTSFQASDVDKASLEDAAFENTSTYNRKRLEYPRVASVLDKWTAPTKGAYNAVAEPVATGVDLLDAGIYGATGTSPGIGDAFRNSPVGPFRKTGDNKADFAMDLTQLVGSAYGGKALAEQTVGGFLKGTSMMARGAKGAAIGLGAGVGGTIGEDKNNEPLFVNDKDSLVPDSLEQSWSDKAFGAPDKNTPKSVQRLKRTADLGQENTILAGPIGAASAPVRWGAKYGSRVLKNIFSPMSEKSMQKDYARELMKIGADVEDGMDQREAGKRIDDFLNEMENVQDNTIKFGDKKVLDAEMSMDTITATERVINNRIANSTDKGYIADQKRKLTQLEHLRATAARSGASPRLENVLAEPRQELSRAVDQFQSTRGGEEAIQKAGRGIQSIADTKVRPVQEQLAEQQTLHAKNQQSIEEQMADEGPFKPIFSETKPGVKLDLDSRANTLEKQMANSSLDATAASKQKNRELWDNIPDNITPKDPEKFVDELEMANLDENDIKDIGDNVNDVKKLVQWAYSKKLDEKIKVLTSSASTFERGKSLSEFKDYITQNLTENVPEFDEWKKYRTEVLGPQYQSGVPKILSENTKKAGFDWVKRDKDNAAAVRDVLTDPKQEQGAKHFADALSEADKDLPGTYAMNQMAKTVQEAFNSGGEKNKELFDKLGQDITKMYPTLQKDSPEIIPQVEQFLNDLRNRTLDAKQIEKKVAEFTEAHEKAKEKYYGSQYEEFFKKQGKEFSRQDNSWEGFKKLLNDPQASAVEDGKPVGRLKELWDSAKDAPKVREGMQAAWAKSAKEAVDRGQTVSDLSEQLEKSGNIVFEGQPEVVSGIKEIIDQTRKAESITRKTGGEGLDSVGRLHRMHKGINQVITFIWGYLDPTATRLRTITSDLTLNADISSKAKRAIDFVLANKNDFITEAKRARESEKWTPSTSFKKTVNRSLAKTLLRDDKEDENLDPLNKQSNKLFK